MKQDNHQTKYVDKLEKKLKQLCYEIYEASSGGRRFFPMKPWVLVRVLPKEHITPGGIILAEKEQNKICYEGIVVEVWQPYNELRDKYTVVDNHKRFETIVISHKSTVKVGDRVAFPHYSGMPVGEYLDDKYYRFVKEDDMLGTLDYQGDAEVSKKIRELTKTVTSITTSGAAIARGADR